MKNTNVLEIDQIPQVAMDSMNEVHREELTIVNSLNAALVTSDENTISDLCNQWLEHTKDHFSKENTMMEKYGFPAFHCHHGEHVEALSQLESKIKSWNETHDLSQLTDYVRETWPQWYVNHISTMDTVTSAFINQSMSKI